MYCDFIIILFIISFRLKQIYESKRSLKKWKFTKRHCPITRKESQTSGGSNKEHTVQIIIT